MVDTEHHLYKSGQDDRIKELERTGIGIAKIRKVLIQEYGRGALSHVTVWRRVKELRDQRNGIVADSPEKILADIEKLIKQYKQLTQKD